MNIPIKSKFFLRMSYISLCTFYKAFSAMLYLPLASELPSVVVVIIIIIIIIIVLMIEVFST